MGDEQQDVGIVGLEIHLTLSDGTTRDWGFSREEFVKPGGERIPPPPPMSFAIALKVIEEWFWPTPQMEPASERAKRVWGKG